LSFDGTVDRYLEPSVEWAASHLSACNDLPLSSITTILVDARDLKRILAVTSEAASTGMG
jgi:hypothetical protein